MLPLQTVRATRVEKPNLAKVTILPYVDRTGSGNFRYLSASLTDAVGSSLKNKFEFIPTGQAATTQASRKLSKEKPRFNAALAAQLQTLTRSDILIFGYFTHDSSENRIMIYTYVSLASGNYFRSLPQVSNTVDATLFRAVDQVAADILSELATIAQAQEKAAASGSAKKPGTKMLLTRDAVRNERPRFRWIVGGSFFAFGRLPDQSGQALSVSPGFSIYAERAVWRSLFVDTRLEFLPLETKIGNAETVLILKALDAMLGFTYHFAISHMWEITAGANFGFFYGKYEKLPVCASGQCGQSAGSAANPALAIRSAINYLLLQNFAIGLEARWTMLADSPESLQLFSLGIKGQYFW